MPKHISAVEARKRLGALLNDVTRTGAEYVIERNGKPTAAVVPIEVYQQHLKDRGDAFDRVETLRKRLTQNASMEDLEDAIDDATASARKRQKQQ